MKIIGVCILRILSVLVAIGGIISAFVLSRAWYQILSGWTGSWPKLATVVAWFFLGGIEIFVLVLVIGFIVGYIFWGISNKIKE